MVVLSLFSGFDDAKAQNKLLSLNFYSLPYHLYLKMKSLLVVSTLQM